MRVTRVTPHDSRLRQHRAEFGISELDREDHRGADHPCTYGCRPCNFCGLPGAEQPPGSDDRTKARQQQRDRPDLSLNRTSHIFSCISETVSMPRHFQIMRRPPATIRTLRAPVRTNCKTTAYTTAQRRMP